MSPGLFGLRDEEGRIDKAEGWLASRGEGESLNLFNIGCAAAERASVGFAFKPPISGLRGIGISFGCSESGEDLLLRF